MRTAVGVASAAPPFRAVGICCQRVTAHGEPGASVVQRLQGPPTQPSVRLCLASVNEKGTFTFAPSASRMAWARGYLHTREKGDLHAFRVYTSTFGHRAPSRANPLSGSA